MEFNLLNLDDDVIMNTIEYMEAGDIERYYNTRERNGSRSSFNLAISSVMPKFRDSVIPRHKEIFFKFYSSIFKLRKKGDKPGYLHYKILAHCIDKEKVATSLLQIVDKDLTLMYAARHDTGGKVVRFLIDGGAVVETRTIEAACHRGNIKALEIFKEKGINVVTELGVHIAAQNGHLKILKILDAEGAELHLEDERALILAIKGGHLPVVKYLIRRGANIHARDELPIKVAGDGGDVEIIKYLIDNGANLRVGRSAPLRAALENGHIDAVEYLLKRESETRPSARDIDMCDFLRSRWGEDGDVTLRLVEILWSWGLSVSTSHNIADMEDRGEVSPLVASIGCGSVQLVKFIIDNGFHYDNDVVSSIRVLIDSYDISQSFRDSSVRMILDFSERKYGRYFALAQGAYNLGYLDIAIKKRYYEIVRLFLQHGVRPGIDSLTLAIKTEAKFRSDVQGKPRSYVLRILDELDDYTLDERVRMTFTIKESMDPPFPKSATALFRREGERHFNSLRELREWLRGLDIPSQSKGIVALHTMGRRLLNSILSGERKLVKLLIQHGAIINMSVFKGAISKKDEWTLRYLLQKVEEIEGVQRDMRVGDERWIDELVEYASSARFRAGVGILGEFRERYCV
jgi:Ankyrin repeats (3 copies)